MSGAGGKTRARPAPQRPLTPPGFLATQDLKERGWTPTLIVRFLGTHDATRENGLRMGRRRLPPVKLYAEARVLDAERDDTFLAAQARAADGRERAARRRVEAATKRAARLAQAAASFTPVIEPEPLRRARSARRANRTCRCSSPCRPGSNGNSAGSRPSSKKCCAACSASGWTAPWPPRIRGTPRPGRRGAPQRHIPRRKAATGERGTGTDLETVPRRLCSGTRAARLSTLLRRGAPQSLRNSEGVGRPPVLGCGPHPPAPLLEGGGGRDKLTGA